MRACRNEELLFREKEFARRQQRSRAVAGKHLVARLRVPPESANRFRHIVVQAENGVFGQIVEESGGFLEEQRQPVFDSRRRRAGRNVAVDPRLRRVTFEHLTETLAETSAAGVVHGKFAGRKQADLGNRIERALRVDVESLDALDFIAKQVQPVR